MAQVDREPPRTAELRTRCGCSQIIPLAGKPPKELGMWLLPADLVCPGGAHTPGSQQSRIFELVREAPRRSAVYLYKEKVRQSTGSTSG